jgi:arylsulfatase A-like enzyme
MPDFIKTPNMDRFLEQSTRFDNFYVAPMCSQSRASLLTGRDFARTGTMLVNVSAALLFLCLARALLLYACCVDY